MIPRPRKPHVPFEELLEREAGRLKQAAIALPRGKERDELMRKSRQIKVAAHLNDWLKSPGLQPPAGK
jgi:hypothetical protein